MATETKPSRSRRTISTIEKFYEFCDRSRIFRRVILYAGYGQMLYALTWATAYADKLLAAGPLSFDAGIIIGAILTPSFALAGKVFQWYNEGRSGEK